jgi:hypothetical protein
LDFEINIDNFPNPEFNCCVEIRRFAFEGKYFKTPAILRDTTLQAKMRNTSRLRLLPTTRIMTTNIEKNIHDQIREESNLGSDEWLFTRN